MDDLEASQRALLLKGIACIISDAERNQRVISTARHAASLFAAYPGANFSVGRIIDEIILAATDRRVAVEIVRPGPESC